MLFEGDNFEDRDFRRVFWRRTTTTVALVTAAANGQQNVMACEWAMMASSNPLCFVISVHPTHLTHDLIEASGQFGLSFCSDKQARLSHISGSYSQHDVDKWTLADFPTYNGTKIAAPLIENSLVNFECEVVGTQKLGHTLFIGKAVWARHDPENEFGPLIYHNGKYWSLGEQVPKDIGVS
jgi:flavin reductase (DIM6/NTAB) family NADH-FMN oxidoreductase RutF